MRSSSPSRRSPRHAAATLGKDRQHGVRYLPLQSTGFAHYIASKGGVIGLTRALASEFGEDGVTINAIAPGLVRTPASTSGRRPGPATGDEFEAAASHQSIKRGLVPEDLIGTLSFLTSDDAAFITGQTLYVNGGKSYV